MEELIDVSGSNETIIPGILNSCHHICFLIFGRGLVSLAIYLTEAYLFLKLLKKVCKLKLLTSACRNPVLLPEVEVLTDRGNLHGTHLQDLAPRKIQGVLDQSHGLDLNLGKKDYFKISFCYLCSKISVIC